MVKDTSAQNADRMALIKMFQAIAEFGRKVRECKKTNIPSLQEKPAFEESKSEKHIERIDNQE
jgi:hypothetical protein